MKMSLKKGNYVALVSLIGLVQLATPSQQSTSDERKSELHKFYQDATTTMLEVCRIPLDSLKIGRSWTDSEIAHIRDLYQDSRLRALKFGEESELCELFGVYKQAVNIMKQLNDKESVQEIKDLYNKWKNICPAYTNGIEMSLMFAKSGLYLGRDRNRQSIRCCKSEDVVKSWEQHKLVTLGKNKVLYGDIVGIANEGNYLTNRGSSMAWDRTELKGWEKWEIVSYHQCGGKPKTFWTVHFCDLIIFKYNGTAQHFITPSGRAYENGRNLYFALLAPTGQIPQWIDN